MLHHYNYSTSLSHFLNYHHHQFEDQQNDTDQTSTCEEDERKSTTSSSQNKSFTIAAILGLKGDHHHHHHHHGRQPDNLNVVNFSATAATASNCRLHMPPMRHHNPSAVVGSPVGNHFAQSSLVANARHSVRGIKHLGGSSSSSGKKSCKSKRVRTIFTPEQLERLEAEFERQQYMVGPERLYLAHTLQLTEAQVKVWFQNRRIKWRKHHLELTHQRLAVLKQQQILLEESHQPDVQDTNSSSSEACDN